MELTQKLEVIIQVSEEEEDSEEEEEVARPNLTVKFLAEVLQHMGGSC